MAHDVFISYSNKDKTIADALCANLEGSRIRCWIAPRDVLPGTPYAEALIDGLNRSRVLVLVFSESSNSSPQVLREIERAVSKGLPVIPFRIENVVPSKSMEYFVSSSHWLDAVTPPLEDHMRKLASTIQILLGDSGIMTGAGAAVKTERKATESAAFVQSPAAESPVIMQSILETPMSTQVKPSPDEVMPQALHLTLSQNILGAICYLFGWVTGIVFLAVGRGNKFVQFHAWQSIIWSVIATLILAVFIVLPPVQSASIAYWSIMVSEYIFGAAVVFLWLFFMFQAYRGRTKTLSFPGQPALKLAKLMPA